MRSVTIAVVALALATGCGGPVGADGGDGGGTDGPRPDGINNSETGGGDGGSGDATMMGDATNPPDDASMMGDATNPPTDAPGPEPDGITPPIDAPLTDGSGCTGALAITITRPTPSQVVETCVPDGMMARFENFTATVSGGTAAILTMDWINEGEGPAAPTFSTAAPPPAQVTFDGTRYTARRQTGGLAAAGAPQPLAIYRNALRNTWTLAVNATDRCGRRFTANQSFTLTFTRSGCPAP